MRSAAMWISLAILPALEVHAQPPGFRPWGGAEYRHSEIRTALEAYRVDWNAYPPCTTYLHRGEQEVWTFANASLTTPIAYLRAMPVDIFSFDERHWTAYFTTERDGASGWVIWSAGPDGDYDFPAATAFDPASPDIAASVRRWDYHATNGTISDGDIITVWR